MCDVLSPMPLIVSRETERPSTIPWQLASVPAILIGVSVVFLGLFLALPLLVILTEALAKGLSAYFDALANGDMIAAILLTLTVTAIVLPVNIIGGLAFAWLLARYRFFGKNIILSLLDLPFSVSPVIAGLSYVLLYGAQGFFATFLKANGLSLIFAVPGMVLVTIFVTFPFVAREVLPLMQALGKADEEAALSLGANGLQTFF